MCVDMGAGFTLSGKGVHRGFTKKGVHRGVHEKGGSQGVHKRGGSQGVHKKGGSREPPWLRACLSHMFQRCQNFDILLMATFSMK